jgi:hypothetical protein
MDCKRWMTFAMTEMMEGRDGSSHYITDIHLDVANWDKMAFNAVSLHHRLHDITTLTWVRSSGESRSTDTSSEARTLPPVVRGRFVA